MEEKDHIDDSLKKTVIIVSGPPGSGSTSVSRMLADKLGYRCFVPGEIQKGLGESKTESDAAIRAWKTDEGSSKKFHEDLDKLQVAEAKRGNVVICGKLSIHFMKDLSDYKVWLDVPLDVRAARAAERDDTKADEAMEKIKAREDIEREAWKGIYGFDYFYQKDIADLVLDSSGMSLEETVQRIMEFIGQNEPDE
jgi:cytidylate kinase